MFFLSSCFICFLFQEPVQYHFLKHGGYMGAIGAFIASYTHTEQWRMLYVYAYFLAPLVILRGFWRCDFPSRHCSSKTVYFYLLSSQKNIPYEGITTHIHIYIVCGIHLFIHNEINTYVFSINNYKPSYHELLFSQSNGLSRDLNGESASALELRTSRL